MRKIGKKGFATTNAVVSGLIGLGFLIVFAFIFFTQLTNDTLTGSNTVADNATNRLVGNFSSGVANVNVQIPTAFTIAVFVLIVTLLIVAYAVARRNGLIGGGGQLG